jgi:antitoxin component YwqK of YwqJK toxin-antitoxin module
MKSFLLIIISMFIGLSQLSAQSETKISEIECYNLGDGRYYCRYVKGEKPLQGKMRIIDGYTSQYTDAVFDKGIPNGSWKTYLRNNLAIERVYKNGLLHGESKEFYNDGTAKSISPFANGLLHGVSKEFNADGSPKSVSPFVNGKAEGKFVTYNWKGLVESELHFKNGLQDGTAISYDTDSNVRSEAAYSQGKESGRKWQRYSNYEMTAHYKDGIYDGEYSEIFTNGNVRVKGFYIDGKKDGTWETGRQDGRITLTEVFANNEKIKETTYFTDGSVNTVRELKNGRKNGWERTYNFGDGSLKSELFYKDGQVSSAAAGGASATGDASGLVKQTKQMSVNGAPFIQTFYQVNGKYEGEYTEQWVNDNKGMKTKGQYLNGQKTGLWIYENRFGQKTREESYLNDKLDGRQTDYDDGEIVSKYYTYKEGRRDGEYAEYNYKTIRRKGNYENGQIAGLQIYYHDNGKPRSEEYRPRNPSETRTHKEFYEDGTLRRETRTENRRDVEDKQYHKDGKLWRHSKINDAGRLEVVEEYDASGKKIK